MTDQITRLLDEIDRLEGHITPGPWEAVGRPYNACVSPAGQIRNLARLGDPLDPEAWKNAEFIALSRTALPQLAKAVKTILSECESFEVAHDDKDNPFHQGVRWTVMAIRQAITDALAGDDTIHPAPTARNTSQNPPQ